jgi:hypothetical protein
MDMKKKALRYGVGLFLASLLFLSCDTGIVGNGEVQTRTKSIGDFTRLEVSGNFNLFLSQTGKPGLRIEADENIMDIIKITETGNKLEIYSELNIIRARKKDIYISFDQLKEIELGGALEVRGENQLNFNTLEIYGGGAADVNLNIKSDLLRIDISGAGDFDLEGEVRNADLIISGAGGFDLLDLRTERMKVKISGAAHARVYATEDLDVEISGAGAVRYRGNPEISRNISGIGTLKKY